MYPTDPQMQTSAFVIHRITLQLGTACPLQFLFSFSFSCSFRQRLWQTRKHSSKIRTVRSSSRLPGGLSARGEVEGQACR